MKQGKLVRVVVLHAIPVHLQRTAKSSLLVLLYLLLCSMERVWSCERCYRELSKQSDMQIPRGQMTAMPGTSLYSLHECRWSSEPHCWRMLWAMACG